MLRLRSFLGGFDPRGSPAPVADGRPTVVLVNAACYGLGACVIVAALAGGVVAPYAALLGLAVTALALGGFDILVLKVHRRESAGLGAHRTADRSRVLVKLCGFWITLALLAGFYGLFSLTPFYDPNHWIVVRYFMAEAFFAAAFLAIPYFWWLDRHLDEPRDAPWAAGTLALNLLCGRIRPGLEARHWAALRTYGLGWVIKGIFLPLMAAYLFAIAYKLAKFDPGGAADWYLLSWDLIVLLDLMVAALGYLATLRVLDSHIRSVNPVWWGWAATLICYYPFILLLSKNGVQYNDARDWLYWLAGQPGLLVLWGALILAVQLVWIWANLTFGLRFSNLTHRGIFTHGPYRFTKHPSYLAKCVGWWLIYLPFLSTQGAMDALTDTGALTVMCVIYWLRARAEERHLSEDPVYAAYAARLDREGILARVNRLGARKDLTPKPSPGGKTDV